jgi:Fuc2NAc and GlcNAc transferase
MVSHAFQELDMIGYVVTIWAWAFVATLVLTRLVLRYAVTRGLLDRPNVRSSHSRPTPRGGGLAIVVIALVGFAVLGAAGIIDRATAAALLGGGTLIAAVGWMDDRRGVSTPIRFALHIVAAVWSVAWLGGMPSLSVGVTAANLGPAGAVIATLAIIWTTNFYNFMDGIDGLAAGEAASAGLVAAGLLISSNPPLAAATAVLAGAAAGFLPWNWQRARIFMGDVGSGFLGFVFATLALASENSGAMPSLIWLVLMAVFFADATITLFRRIFRREPWYAAHRSHAYQRAVQAGWSHRRVTATVLVMNAGLAFVARLATRAPENLPRVLLVVAIFMAVLYLAVERWSPMSLTDAAPLEKPAP